MPVVNKVERNEYRDFIKMDYDITEYVLKTDHKVFSFGDIKNQRIYWITQTGPTKCWWIRIWDLRKFITKYIDQMPDSCEMLKTPEGRNDFF